MMHCAFSNTQLAPRSQRNLVYVQSVAKHPLHVFALAWFPLLALLTGWMTTAFAVFLASELVLLCAVSTLPRYRRWVDERRFARECTLAAQARLRLFAQMTSTHGRELQVLEKLADKVRDRLTPGDAASEETDCLGIDDLLATYARSAVSYATARATMDAGGASESILAADIQGLAESLKTKRTAESRRVTVRRLEVMRLRSARWEKSSAELDVIADQLALIADIVRLTCEHAGAPVASSNVSHDLERAVSSMSETERTIADLTALLASDASFDARMLRKGRLGRPQPTEHVRIATEASPGTEAAAALAMQLRAADYEREPDLVATPLKAAHFSQKL